MSLRTKTLALGVWAAACAACGAQPLAQTYSASGQLIVTQFVTAPFPHTNRSAGYIYKGELFSADKHYNDSTVAIFIPKGFRETGRVDVVIHFHGWRNTVEGTLKQFKLIEQFVESGKNAVLVVPEGPHDAPDSFGGKLEDPDGFKRFIGELLAALKERGGFAQTNFAIGQIILSGHSGGYRVISAILDHGGLSKQISEVWLFDALYAETDRFLAWSDAQYGRLLNIYTDGGGTKDDSELMMTLLKQRGAPFLATEDAKVTAGELKTNKLIFLHTDLGHNDVVEKRKAFREFLQTSALANLVGGP